jgi:hypothetical protein
VIRARLKTLLLAALVAASFLSAIAFKCAFAQTPKETAKAAQAQETKPASSTPAAPAQPAAPKPAQIDRNGVLILVRTTLLALDQANKTGNYTVLRELGSLEFQRANTAARLGEIFVSERKKNLDLSGVAVLDPQLTLLPQIEANGLMHMAGFFPSVANQLKFEMLFAPAGNQWKLFGLGVTLGQAAPAPPSPDAPPSAAAKEPENPTQPAPAAPKR